jgi:AraC family transcriptional regulator, activator of mtrCDE
MSERVLERLLLTLDVVVEAFAICEIRHGARLVGRPLNTIELHYVLAGTLHLTTSAGDSVVCGPGSVVLIPPGVGQTMAADDGLGRDVLAIEHCSKLRDGMMLFDAAGGEAGDLRIICGVIVGNPSGSIGLLDNLRRPIAEHLGGSDLVRNAFAAMLAEITSPSFGSRALTGALMKVCLITLLRQHLGHEVGLFNALRDPRLGKAVAAVLDRPAAAHSVAALASTAAMSRSSFAREFTAAFDITPMEFVAKTRLHHAAEMLRSTQLPIKVVASSIGFSSRSHFSRAFSAAYGLDPSKFRKSGAKAELDAPPSP